MVNLQAGSLRGTVAISAPSQELAAKADRTGAEAEKS
jgi:hypothetical protein